MSGSLVGSGRRGAGPRRGGAKRGRGGEPDKGRRYANALECVHVGASLPGPGPRGPPSTYARNSSCPPIQTWARGVGAVHQGRWRGAAGPSQRPANAASQHPAPSCARNRLVHPDTLGAWEARVRRAWVARGRGQKGGLSCSHSPLWLSHAFAFRAARGSPLFIAPPASREKQNQHTHVTLRGWESLLLLLSGSKKTTPKGLRD